MPEFIQNQDIMEEMQRMKQSQADNIQSSKMSGSTSNY
jgi:hypothetical protein